MLSPARTDIADFILKALPEHPHTIVAFVAQTFSISRQRAYEHVLKQIKNGKVMKTGRTSSTQYFLSTANSIDFTLKIESNLREDEVWTQYCKPKLIVYPENVYRICHYGFTEIFNNAIDHSEGERIHCNISVGDGKIRMVVQDDGVGIFQKIQDALHLASIREAVLHLSKGKFTTDPSRHSGEGIFFTSRAVDRFSILSSDMFFEFYQEDWLLSKERSHSIDRGTFVIMEVSMDSKKTTKEVMSKYSDQERGFHQTTVAVQLSKDENDPHVSRSQAKRLLVGLDRFKHVVLDFKNVQSVGQAFVDEVFRVFKIEHPKIRITYVNANDDIEFMIKRGLATQ